MDHSTRPASGKPDGFASASKATPKSNVAVALFVLLTLAFGHLLGGNDPEQRSLLATEAATRNPALALIIARANYPNAHVANVLVPYIVTFLVLTSLYRFSQSHRSGGTGTRRKASTVRTGH